MGHLGLGGPVPRLSNVKSKQQVQEDIGFTTCGKECFVNSPDTCADTASVSNSAAVINTAAQKDLAQERAQLAFDAAPCSLLNTCGADHAGSKKTVILRAKCLGYIILG